MNDEMAFYSSMVMSSVWMASSANTLTVMAVIWLVAAIVFYFASKYGEKS